MRHSFVWAVLGQRHKSEAIPSQMKCSPSRIRNSLSVAAYERPFAKIFSHPLTILQRYYLAGKWNGSSFCHNIYNTCLFICAGLMALITEAVLARIDSFLRFSSNLQTSPKSFYPTARAQSHQKLKIGNRHANGACITKLDKEKLRNFIFIPKNYEIAQIVLMGSLTSEQNKL